MRKHQPWPAFSTALQPEPVPPADPTIPQPGTLQLECVTECVTRAVIQEYTGAGLDTEPGPQPMSTQVHPSSHPAPASHKGEGCVGGSTGKKHARKPFRKSINTSPGTYFSCKCMMKEQEPELVRPDPEATDGEQGARDTQPQ